MEEENTGASAEEMANNWEVVLTAIKNMFPTIEPIIRQLIQNSDQESARANILRTHDIDCRAAITKRHQYAMYIILAGIVVLVSGLAYIEVIHGSAAAGILGAVAGHIFCNANRAG